LENQEQQKEQSGTIVLFAAPFGVQNSLSYLPKSPRLFQLWAYIYKWVILKN
jgi:hypothetical protein